MHVMRKYNLEDLQLFFMFSIKYFQILRNCFVIRGKNREYSEDGLKLHWIPTKIVKNKNKQTLVKLAALFKRMINKKSSVRGEKERNKGIY